MINNVTFRTVTTLACIVALCGGKVCTASAEETSASASMGSTTLNLKARIVESTCVFSFGGANGGTLDMGDFTYTNVGTATAPKYMVYSLDGKGEVTKPMSYALSMKADPSCQQVGVLMMHVSGFDAATESTKSGTVMFNNSTLSGCLRAHYTAANGSQVNSCFPYRVVSTPNCADALSSGIVSVWSAGRLVRFGPDRYIRYGIVDSNGNSVGICNSAFINGVVPGRQAGGYALGELRDYLVVGPYRGRVQNIGAAVVDPGFGGLSDGSAGEPQKISSFTFGLNFSGPVSITELWGNTPPPAGTVYTGRLTFTASYM